MSGAVVSRRAFVGGLSLVGAATWLGGCSTPSAPTATPARPSASAGPATGRDPGPDQAVRLAAGAAQFDLGGAVVTTWAYDSSLPGPLIRATAGQRITITVTNALPEPTSVHWHGLAVPNRMDGVPGVTTPQISTGGSFTYDFVVPDAGTHWFHPHHGLQLDRGLYGALIVDSPDEPGDYEHEWVLLLDDWTDGWDRTPQEHLEALRAGDRDGGGPRMGMHRVTAGDVDYPAYLVNGRTSEDPEVLRALPGDRVRLRVINAAADTVFDIALTSHTLTVTHTDGFPVQATPAASVRLGMGERVDALVTLDDGAFAVVARPVGKTGLARALVRTGAGEPPAAAAVPAEMADEPLGLLNLTAAPGSQLPAGQVGVTHDVALTGPYPGYIWAINGEAWPDVTPLQIREGESARLRLRNHSMMPHPVHVHGHTGQVGDAGGSGPRKDTVLLPPMAGVDLTVAADNPGSWMLHCHNAYHAEAGMITRLDYT